MYRGLCIVLLGIGCGSDNTMVYHAPSKGFQDDETSLHEGEEVAQLEEVEESSEEPTDDPNMEEPEQEEQEETEQEETAEQIEEADEQEDIEEWEEEEEFFPEPPSDDCTDTSDLIYVVDKENYERLYTYDPLSNSFEVVGELDCSLFGQPTSMSVSRDGYAYVRYTDQSIYKVDLSDLSCTESSYSNGSFGSFGMGYATNSSATWEDTLYLANDQQLVSLDTQTWNTNVIGSMPSQSELTGNADGELWAFLPLEEPATLARIHKSNANLEESIYLNNFPEPTNIDTFAFAYWGGDFYLFVREYGMGNSTNVYKVEQNGNMTMVLEGSGIDIVGAGVSTCAPTTQE